MDRLTQRKPLVWLCLLEVDLETIITLNTLKKTGCYDMDISELHVFYTVSN